MAAGRGVSFNVKSSGTTVTPKCSVSVSTGLLGSPDSQLKQCKYVATFSIITTRPSPNPAHIRLKKYSRHKHTKTGMKRRKSTSCSAHRGKSILEERTRRMLGCQKTPTTREKNAEVRSLYLPFPKSWNLYEFTEGLISAFCNDFASSFSSSKKRSGLNTSGSFQYRGSWCRE